MTRSVTASAPGFTAAGPAVAPRVAMTHLDHLGMAASTLCAVHCAILPFLLGLLPLVGMSFVAHGAFEWGMVSFAGLLGSIALLRGHRVHRRHSVWCLFVPGVLLLLSGLLFFANACCAPGIRLYRYDAAQQRMVVARTISPSGEFPWRAVVMAAGGLSIAAAHFVNLRLCRACHTCHASAQHDEARTEAC